MKPNRSEIEAFKSNLTHLLDSINDGESEEFHKNLVIDFLKKTYYDPNHFINTKGRNDLVIHNGEKASSTVGVIVEAKKPTNKSEMLKVYAANDSHEQMIAKINTKAFQELVLYYLRERITHKNIEIKYLIATNINEWFIFDATTFDRLFAQNKILVKQFADFEAGRLADTKTDFFYKQIAEPFITGIKQSIEYTYFDIREYEKPLRNADLKDDNKLIALFKLLSPEHLLKLPFTNDSNSLDRRFYGELLHIIGLTETKEGSKKIIERNKEGERNSGTFIENAIIQLDSLDKISRLENPSQFGAKMQERLFNVALELSITWINRILFLKLLEAQLITYHKGDKAYEFLNFQKIQDYDDLNSLFFQVLARKPNERNEDVKSAFSKVPYLNSSLFEPTEIEHSTLFISQLRNDKAIPLFPLTVLKDDKGKKRTGELNPLEYLFAFLSAYDFTSEGSEDIQEDNKTLINASVLGLIFEKINGYKDGSFFTPGFITMYMCRETIRKAVIQKFNEAKGWNCEDINSLYDKIDDRAEANKIVNDIKICDPAVGSGHFLVSALNEMIAIKSDLKILQDRDGRRLKEYHFEVVNDELIVTDEDGELFEYNPANKESQRIQETLFHEKQTIIENCLFGVDINPNSVKICRLRLWIELLKNAYYKNETELETLPNIDINIKCGNSLISRFAIDADLKQALRKSASKWTIDSYRIAVDTYRNAQSKEQKREMERLINEIKTNFRSEISQNDPKVKRLRNLSGELFTMTNQGQLFELSKKEKADWNAKVTKLSAEVKKLETEIEEIKNNKIYENAFEWRFEFPEVLNDNGDFVGFDVVIGNPPYFQIQYSDYSNCDYFKSFKVFERTGDIYSLFFEKSIEIIREKGVLSLITSNRFCNTNYGLRTRDFLSKFKLLTLINFNDVDVFEEANVSTIIISLAKEQAEENNKFSTIQIDNLKLAQTIGTTSLFANNNSNQKYFGKEQWVFSDNKILDLKYKIKSKSISLSQVEDIKINRGITTGANSIFIISKEVGDMLISKDHKNSEIIRPVLKGAEIKRYLVKDFNNYIILTKTGVEIEKYPDIYNYLVSNKKELDNVYEAKNGMKKWYELRRCSYYDSFEDEKLIWTRLSAVNSFAISTKREYSIDSTSFATGKNLKYYCALLNSKLTLFYFKLGSVIWGTDGIKWFGDYFDSIPIININSEEMKPIIDLYDRIVMFKEHAQDTDTTPLENEIDHLVYQLYELTPEEIAIIEAGV
ncbi:MAG: Eco57I restriction-modification methylase domain-containing protein [Bacteroidales bacterium]|nr:Eco57I restriction-modification methylase domain-containing protein [Bacteroidales bacterium]